MRRCSENGWSPIIKTRWNVRESCRVWHAISATVYRWERFRSDSIRHGFKLLCTKDGISYSTLSFLPIKAFLFPFFFFFLSSSFIPLWLSKKLLCIEQCREIIMINDQGTKSLHLRSYVRLSQYNKMQVFHHTVITRNRN